MPPRFAFLFFAGVTLVLAKFAPATSDNPMAGAMAGVVLAACVTAIVDAGIDFVQYLRRKS